jgi:hypothetical protein
MTIPFFIGLILLVAVIVARFGVGSKRRGLAATSDLSIALPRRTGKVAALENHSARANPISVRPARSSASERMIPQASDTLTKQPNIRPTIPGSRKNTPVKIMPSGKLTTVNPSTVIKIRSSIPNGSAVIIEPRPTIVIRPSQAFVVTPATVGVTTIAPSRAVTVAVPERGAWDERGWRRNTGGRSETYDGYYVVGERQFRGRVEARNRRREISAFIYDPPREIRHHEHGACFQQVGNGWFILHWARPAGNVDDAILYMEKVLDESLHR